MIPIWIFAIFIILFVGALAWEKIEYNKMKSEYETLEFFLDLYIEKYGNLDVK